jgi:hypothetical protein
VRLRFSAHGEEAVVPFYREHGLKVGAIPTDNGREFCSMNNPFELYLALNDIEHRRTKGKMDRQHQTVQKS